VTKEKLTRENRRVVNLDIKRHGGPNRVLSLPILHHLPNHTQTKPSFELNNPPVLSPESHALLSEVKLEPDYELRVNDLIANGDNGGEQESRYAHPVIVPSSVNENHVNDKVLPDPQPICVPPTRRFDLRSKPTHQHHFALWSDEAKGRSHTNIRKPPKKKVLRALPLTPKRRFDMDEPAPQPVKKRSLLRRTARFLTFGLW